MQNPYVSSQPRVVSVNVALPVDIPEVRSAAATAINKQPITGKVSVHKLGLTGDDVGDKRFHGGPDKAVYAFAREDLDLWSQRLGTYVPSGSMFGENLTTSGIDVNEAVVGERWRVGTTVLEVCNVRIPCKVFANWLCLSGFPADDWMRRFIGEARPGPYLRVIEEGQLQAGDDIHVIERPAHGITISTMFRALTTDRTLLPQLLEVRGLPERARSKAQAYADSGPVTSYPLVAGTPASDDVNGGSEGTESARTRSFTT